ncbi:hypothetical protein OSTOST_08800 [Ostertagia ostertagi]
MGSFVRSEEMRFCQLIVEKEAAFNCVAELGKQPYVQFKDLNPDVNPFQRTFVRHIRRYDEMERKLRFLESQITKDEIPIAGRLVQGDYSVMPTAELNQLETTLTDLERDVQNMNESDAQLKKNYMELKEWEAVLEKTDEFFHGGLDDQAAEELDIQEEEYSKAREGTDQRIKVQKDVFIVFYKGDRLRNIVEKVCDGFKAKLMKNCPKTFKDRQSARIDVKARLQDVKTVLGQTQEHRYRVLQRLLLIITTTG